MHLKDAFLIIKIIIKFMFYYHALRWCCSCIEPVCFSDKLLLKFSDKHACSLRRASKLFSVFFIVLFWCESRKSCHHRNMWIFSCNALTYQFSQHFMPQPWKADGVLPSLWCEHVNWRTSRRRILKSLSTRRLRFSTGCHQYLYFYIES